MKKYFLILLLALVMPGVAFGQSSPTLGSLIKSALGVLALIVPFVIGLGLLTFLFGIIKYVTAGGGEEKTKARDLMIWGIVALFVMIAVWGLVNFIRNALGISSNPDISSPEAPNINYNGGSGGVFSNLNGTS